MSEQNDKALMAAGSATPGKSMIPFSPQNLNEALTISGQLAQSDLCPKSFGNRKENVLAAIMMGHELGFGVMQSLSNIAVVNGRASIWGEGVTALIQRAIREEGEGYFTDKVTGEGDKLAVTVTSKRKGQPEYSVTYTWEDAKRAGLTSKDTYQKYPKDMLYWKAAGRVAKRQWADVLKGIAIRENMDEMEPVEVDQVRVYPTDSPAPEKPKDEPKPEPKPEPKKPGRPPKAEKAPEPQPEPEKPAQSQPEAPAAPVEEELAGPEDAKGEEAEAKPVLRAIGTYEKAVKLLTTPPAFAARVLTGDGLLMFVFDSYEAAVATKPLTGKTVEVMHEAITPPIAGVAGKVVKFGATSK